MVSGLREHSRRARPTTANTQGARRDRDHPNLQAGARLRTGQAAHGRAREEFPSFRGSLTWPGGGTADGARARGDAPPGALGFPRT